MTLPTYEISAQLATEGTPLNRTSVGEILAEEGFGRLLRHPDPVASTSPATPGRDTRLPRAARVDFATWPATVETGQVGLLLLVPDLVELDLPTLVTHAAYPGTRVIPALSWLLSLLALKLTRTRRDHPVRARPDATRSGQHPDWPRHRRRIHPPPRPSHRGRSHRYEPAHHRPKAAADG